MYLKKLEIQGFKSFANKTVLEFEPGITSVVGPNGSGKSNIADSLRWVFGEQSMKLLRSKKSEDVIFAGSDQKARLGACEVMVYFDNTDHKMPLAYEEVVIGRRLYRDGNSEYLINGTQVRLLDIEEILLKSGFGNTSYCVIGQGMIDQMVLGGPTAVKEMIEEAAGIKPYYFKRDRTLRRLDRTSVNLGQVVALIAEIEPRLRSLRRQAKKLERRSEIENELKSTQISHFGYMLKSLDAQIFEVRTRQEVFDKQISELNAEMAELSKNIES
ncbi:MAG: AAA family ATPase, partial [bacterium]|nr:AAA family ATPase [bacterium]